MGLIPAVLGGCALVALWLLLNGRVDATETVAAALAACVALFASMAAARSGLGLFRVDERLLGRLYLAPWHVLRDSWIVLTRNGKGEFQLIQGPPGDEASTATATWLLGLAPNSYVVLEGEELLVHQYVPSGDPLREWLE